jgi:hypothetical protein
LGISERVIQKIRNGKTQTYSLMLLKNISLLLGEYNKMFDIRKLEKEIFYLRTKGSTSGKLYFPKFPINFNCFEGGVVIGGLFGDSGLRKDLRPFYANKDRKRIKEFVRSLRKVVGSFKVSGVTKTYSPTKEGSITYSCDLPKIIGIILHYGLGIKRGDKVIHDPPLPSFCFKASPEFKRGLLMTFFTDESAPHPTGRDRFPQITFRQAALLKNTNFPKRVLGIKSLLEGLGFKPITFLEDVYCGKNGKVGVLNLSLSKFDDVIRFFNEIGFSSKIKSRKLKELLQKSRRKTSKEDYLFKKKNRFITSYLSCYSALT